MKISKKMMKKAMRAFAEAMEEGGPKTPEELLEKREALKKAREEYLNADEAHFFVWGYLTGIASKKE